MSHSELDSLKSIEFIQTDDISLERSSYTTALNGVDLHISEYHPDFVSGLKGIIDNGDKIEVLIDEPLSERATLFLCEFNLPTLIERFNFACMSGDRSEALYTGQALASKIALSELLTGAMVIRQIFLPGDDVIPDKFSFSGYGRIDEVGEVAILAVSDNPAPFWAAISLIFDEASLAGSDF